MARMVRRLILLLSLAVAGDVLVPSPKCHLSRLEEDMAGLQHSDSETMISSTNTNDQCPLSRLEEDLAGLHQLEGGKMVLPSLQQLGRNYPGEEFVMSGENSCQDNPAFHCPELAGRGACNGSFHDLERRSGGGVG